MTILQTLLSIIDKPRESISTYAPKLVVLKIPVDMIGKLIGPGGSNIKRLQESTGTTIEVEDDGTVYISCFGGDNHLKVKETIELMTKPVEIGKVYNGRVVSIKDFGAFIEIAPGKEGLCHISELAGGYVESVSDVCRMGDDLQVKVIAIDEQGRIKLSRKAAMTEKKKSPVTASESLNN